MMRGLVWKEVRQHRWAMLVVVGLSLLTHGVIVGTVVLRPGIGSVFEALRFFGLVMLPLAAWVVAHRLVVGEYQAKTQLFLEGLPVSRLGMVGVKYGLGLVVVGGLAGVAYGLTLGLGRSQEFLTLRYLGLMAVKLGVVGWFAYSFFFLMGFTGRYRVALYLAMLLGAVALESLTAIEWDQLGPLALLDDRFAYERLRWPGPSLAVTAGLAAGFSLLAFGLALVREGSVAALMAERMSQREKVFVAAVLTGALFTLGMVEEKRLKAPFRLVGADEAVHDGVKVQVQGPPQGAPGCGGSSVPPGETEGVNARGLADAAAAALAGVKAVVGLERLPPVFIVLRADLDVGRYQGKALEESDGYHVEANWVGAGWSQRDFLVWLIGRVLEVASSGGSKHEERRWVADGLGMWWLTRGGAAEGDGDDTRRLRLRAAYGVPVALTRDDLSRWNSFRERVGDRVAEAVAWSGLEVFTREQGEERTRAFLRATLGTAVSKDLRATLATWRNPVERLVSVHGGWGMDLWLGRWNEQLKVWREELHEELASVPRLEGEMEGEAVSGATRLVRHRVRLVSGQAPRRVALLHHELPAYDDEVEPPKIQREDQAFAEGKWFELPGAYGPGSRLYWTFTAHAPELGCEVISGWRREAVR